MGREGDREVIKGGIEARNKRNEMKRNTRRKKKDER